MSTLKKVKTALNFIKKTNRPILQYIEVKNGLLTCTDLDTSIKIKDSFELKEGLQDIATFGLTDGLPLDDDFPLVDFDINKVDTVTLLSIDKLAYIAKFASNDETRIFLNGVAIDSGHMVACSGFVLNCEELDDEIGGSYIMPTTSIKILVKLCKAYGIKNITIDLDDTFAVIDNVKFTLKMRLIQRQFPKWEALIPNKYANTLKIDTWIDFKKLKPLFEIKPMCTIKYINGSIVLIPKHYPEKQYVLGKSDEKFDDIGYNPSYLELASNGQKSFEIKYNPGVKPSLVNEAIVMPLKL